MPSAVFLLYTGRVSPSIAVRLTPYQIVVPLIALIAILYAWNLTIRQRKTIWETSLWTAFWAVIAFIALKPNFLSYLSAATGIRDQESAVLVTFLGILFFVVFSLVIRIEELEQRNARIVRALGLREAGLSPPKKGEGAPKDR